MLYQMCINMTAFLLSIKFSFWKLPIAKTIFYFIQIATKRYCLAQYNMYVIQHDSLMPSNSFLLSKVINLQSCVKRPHLQFNSNCNYINKEEGRAALSCKRQLRRLFARMWLISMTKNYLKRFQQSLIYVASNLTKAIINKI